MTVCDISIVNGFIVDGTGDPRWEGNVGIRDGRIVLLGGDVGEARQTIDAKGKIVSPGFVDIHTHYDAQLLWDQAMSISPWHGVTTVVIGNCGFGIAPTRRVHRDLILRTLERVEGMRLAALQKGLGEERGYETFPEYLDLIESKGTAINVGVLLGHTPIRFEAMGEDAVRRESSPEEMKMMKNIVREGMEVGGLGLSLIHI